MHFQTRFLSPKSIASSRWTDTGCTEISKTKFLLTYLYSVFILIIRYQIKSFLNDGDDLCKIN